MSKLLKICIKVEKKGLSFLKSLTVLKDHSKTCASRFTVRIR